MEKLIGMQKVVAFSNIVYSRDANLTKSEGISVEHALASILKTTTYVEYAYPGEAVNEPFSLARGARLVDQAPMVDDGSTSPEKHTNSMRKQLWHMHGFFLCQDDSKHRLPPR